MRVLVTRPQPDAERTAAALRTRGHEVLLAPLLRFCPIEAPQITAQAWGGILVTSANAVRALWSASGVEKLQKLPLLAVGRQTAAAARAAGFTRVQSAHGDVHDLALAAANRFAEAAPLLYPAAEDRSADLAAALKPFGVPVQTVITYRMVPASRFPEEVLGELGGGRVEGVLHYSRRSAESFLSCARADKVEREALAAAHFCLSEQIGEVLKRSGASTVRIADKPEEPDLLALLDAA